MTRLEYLLNQLQEECAEVIQAASKAKRFGLGSKSPYNGKTNEENIKSECIDLFAVIKMLVDENQIRMDLESDKKDRDNKIEKVNNYYKIYSKT